MKKRAIQNILVPVDFSPMSIEAIAAAKSLAQQTGATVHLAHVHHAQYPVGFRGPVLPQSEYAVSFEEHRKEALSDDLQELARRHGLARASAVHLCEGVSVYRETCRHADRAVLVVPSHPAARAKDLAHIVRRSRAGAIAEAGEMTFAGRSAAALAGVRL